MTRILITGSRDWDKRSGLEWVLNRVVAECEMSGDYKPTLISGACPTGADAQCERLWEAWGLPIERHPADWKAHGKKAGFLRNQEMVDSGADLCLAFIKNNSKGATMTASIAEKAGIPVRIYRDDRRQLRSA